MSFLSFFFIWVSGGVERILSLLYYVPHSCFPTIHPIFVPVGKTAQLEEKLDVLKIVMSGWVFNGSVFLFAHKIICLVKECFIDLIKIIPCLSLDGFLVLSVEQRWLHPSHLLGLDEQMSYIHINIYLSMLTPTANAEALWQHPISLDWHYFQSPAWLYFHEFITMSVKQQKFRNSVWTLFMYSDLQT